MEEHYEVCLQFIVKALTSVSRNTIKTFCCAQIQDTLVPHINIKHVKGLRETKITCTNYNDSGVLTGGDEGLPPAPFSADPNFNDGNFAVLLILSPRKSKSLTGKESASGDFIPPYRPPSSPFAHSKYASGGSAN